MANTANPAHSGKAVTTRREVFSNEDLYVDGALEDRIELPAHILTVGPHGTIKTGVIQAATVLMLGAVPGDVNAQDKVEIRQDVLLLATSRLPASLSKKALTLRLAWTSPARRRWRLILAAGSHYDQPEPRAPVGMARRKPAADQRGAARNENRIRLTRGRAG